MRFLEKVKDGGPDSPVDAFVLIEIKNLITIQLLRFNQGSRENYHSHAFNAISWFLSGSTIELKKQNKERRREGVCFPHFTPKDLEHRYICLREAWCLTIRGPWRDWWIDGDNVLTHGRQIINQKRG